MFRRNTLFLTYYCQHNLDVKVACIFNIYGPTCIPIMAKWVAISLCKYYKAKTLRFIIKASKRVVFGSWMN
jgi:nucleoside-diphosphate-sugar epimerase